MIRLPLLPAALAAVVLVVAPAQAQKKNFTFDQAVGNGRFGISLGPRLDSRVSWLDGRTYVVERGDEKFAYDAISGEQRPLKPLAASPSPPAPIGRGRRGRGAGASHPTGAYTVRIKDNDLYVAEQSGEKERRITRDGSATILNGTLDWVYEEEVYGRGNKIGYSWSPDGKYLAYLRLDEAPVKPFTIVDHLPKLQNAESEQYPKAGEPNPTATLWVTDVTRPDSAPVKVNLDKYPEGDRLLVRFGFTPDSGRLLVQVQNRIQNALDLCSADPKTGGDVKVLIGEKNDSGWVDVTEGPRWLQDGTFLWWSDRSGYRHLYRYRADGTLLGPVTHGDWDVRDILRVDEEGGRIYVETNGVRVSERHYFRARLDGKGEIVRLTQGDGTHSLTFAPGDGFFLDTVSNAGNPGEVRVCDDSGKVLRTVARYTPPAAAADYNLGQPKFLTFTARDGYPLEGTLLLPPDWTPGKKVAIYCSVYSGPASPTARNAWSAVSGSVFHQYLAQNGIAVWLCDNRTANPRGNKARFAQYKQFGVSELADIEDGLSYLIAQGYADRGRIAIQGWSFGGFMTAYALTHSTFFKVGIAGAGVMDWNLYDTIYTERYMSTPQLNPDGYKKGSVIDGAPNLSGKLLMVHGMMDDNVHVQNSVQLAYALQKAGKDFQMMLYPAPTSRHGIGDPDQNRHLNRLMADFLVKNL